VNRFVQVWLLIVFEKKLGVIAPPQLSLPVTNAGSGAGTCSAQVTVCGAGQVIAGPVWSLTVMIWEQVAELLQASVAR
jgi:hypothetical protein